MGMAPAPQHLDQVLANYMVQNQEGGPRHNTIALAVLIDFIIQRTYHDLSVLAELLPRKTDMERKIEIYEFASRTRQLFIRLIALVKWANSVSKVDKSANIMSFLDKQNMLFVESADMLARLARDALVRARLPHYHIPAAVEVMTTGMYKRLPSTIRKRIVPPPRITYDEQQQTLLRLNQIVSRRLADVVLPAQMRNFKIYDGRVTFVVADEFRTSLTIMGDSPYLPWRMISLEILVPDQESGDGNYLVHDVQVEYIHRYVQFLLLERSKSLNDMYESLHYFCQSLQLEVLYMQAYRMCYSLHYKSIKIEEYVPGEKLILSYWHLLAKKDLKTDLGFLITIETEKLGTDKTFTISHMPSLGCHHGHDIEIRPKHSEYLTMERLLINTIYIRSICRLNEIKMDFLILFNHEELINLQGTPPILTVPVLSPCLRAEQLHVTVDSINGIFRCHVPKHLDCPIMIQMQNSLNGNRIKLPYYMTQLRYWITFQRCQKTLQHLPATAFADLNFLTTPTDPILKPGRHKVYVKFHRHNNTVLVVRLKENIETPNEMEYDFYLGFVKYEDNHPTNADVRQNAQNITLEGSENSIGAGDSSETSRVFVKNVDLIPLDTYITTHGPATNMDYEPPHKRKCGGETGIPVFKQMKPIYPAYFIPDLAHVVAFCDEKIPFLALANTLQRHKIPTSGVQVEKNATSLNLRILCFPKPIIERHQELYCPSISDEAWNDLLQRISSINIRSQMNKNNQIRSWVLEYKFVNTPLQTLPIYRKAKQSPQKPIYLTYDQTSNYGRTVEDMLKDWKRIVFLYTIVYKFAQSVRGRLCIREMVHVISYNYLNLLFSYGPKKEVICKVFWSPIKNGFDFTFLGGLTSINAHSAMRDLYASNLNYCHDLLQTITLLSETYSPLSSIAKLPLFPTFGTIRSPAPVLSFCIIPQSCTAIRLNYQSVYSLDIRFRRDRLVSIRDASYSRFDRSISDDVSSIQSLKKFLAKYVDEDCVCRSLSQNEDDNPPSPMVLEDSFCGSSSVSAGGSSPFLSGNIRGPQSPRDCGIRFPAPHTPPSSNPHTPASPHHSSSGTGASCGGGSSSGGGPQNHPNYNLTSPPASHIPHPSPGGLLPASPLNPQPSPHTVHSPGPSTIYMQGHQDSPFTAMSPANTNWPGSPSMPRPSPRPGQSPDHKSIGSSVSNQNISGSTPQCTSRNRSRTISFPISITHEKFDLLCRPSPHPCKELCHSAECSPLERFLGCIYLARLLHRHILTDDTLVLLSSSEPGILSFKADALQCQVILNPNHMQSLHLKVTGLAPVPTPDNKPPIQLNSDDFATLEQFFETRVAIAPYKSNSILAFSRLLTCTPQVLRDFVQIMRLDLKPEIFNDPFKWMMNFCLRVPPMGISPIIPIGSPAVLIIRLKILFFLHITRIPYNGTDWKDSPAMLLPMVYDLHSNITQLAEKREHPQSPSVIAVGSLLRRFAEYSANQGQCSLFPAVRELLINLQLPNDVPPSNQPIGPPVSGMVNANANLMIHSPMQQIAGGIVCPQGAPSYTAMPQNPGVQ